MTFEQPKEFNQFLCLSTPWTQARLWAIVKLLSPFLVLICVAFVEARVLQGLSIMPAFIGGFILIPLMIAMVWVGDQAENCSKRTLQLKDNGIHVRSDASPCYRPKILWRDVLCFQVEPAGPHGEFSKVTIHYARRSPTGRRSWSIILTEAVQYDALISELKNRQLSGFGRFIIKESIASTPPPQEFKAPSALDWLCALALYLLIHGLPPLVFGLLPLDHPPQNGPQYQKVSPHLAAWVNRFSSGHEFRYFLAATGAILTGAGAGCLGLVTAVQRRQIRAYRAELLTEENIGRR